MRHGCKGYNDIKGTCPATLFDTKIISQNMEHFTSFIVCTLLLLNSEGSSTSQRQCSVRNVCSLLDNVSNQQDRLEKKVKEHSAILGGRCNEGKVFSGLSTFNTASVRTLFYSQDFLSFTRSKFNT